MTLPHLSRLTAASVLALVTPHIALADPTFDFYGQLNFGFFNVDDGTESETFFTDNDNSNTRVGLRYSNDLASGGTIKFNFETALGFAGSSSATFADNDLDLDLSRTDLRKLEIAYVTPAIGTFSLGQGSMSADGVTEADFSGTGVVSYVGITDLAGSFQFRPEDGALSGTSIGSTFGAFDGARRLRVRYDTPDLNGFTASASWGEEELNQDDDRTFTDVGIRYGKDYDGIEVDGRLAYQWIDVDQGENERILAGSFAMRHAATGTSVAIAAGRPEESDASYVYAKFGYQQNWLSAGSTALSFDIYEGDDFSGDSSDSTSYAISAVQRVDAYNLELYASYRTFELDTRGTNFEDIDLIVVGARLKF
ncbi:MAG: porin [Roseobacter sp.]